MRDNVSYIQNYFLTIQLLIPKGGNGMSSPNVTCTLRPIKDFPMQDFIKTHSSTYMPLHYTRRPNTKVICYIPNNNYPLAIPCILVPPPQLTNTI